MVPVYVPLHGWSLVYFSVCSCQFSLYINTLFVFIFDD
jgi:hypothetical protein